MLSSRSSCQLCCRSAVARRRGRVWVVRRSLATATSNSTALEVTDPFVLYQNLVASGRIKWDEEQVRLLVQLKHVHQTLVHYEPSPSLRWLLESSSMKEKVAPAYGAAALPARILPSFRGERSLVKALTNEDDLSMLDSPTGFMLTGSVGTGKTMLLDLFYKSLPVKKQRIHYHAFLLGLYRKVFVALEEQRVQLEGEEHEMQRLAGEDISQGYPWSRREENKAKALTKGWRQVFASGRKFDDPKLVKEYVLARVALDLITNATVMAFDEVQLVDIAGAGIIRRVLTWYWRLGGVVIATSNRLPSDLYQHGIQQDQFQTFLTHLQERCPVHELRSPNDWRRRDRASHLGFEDTEQASWVANFEGSTTWFTDAQQFAGLAGQAIDVKTAKANTLSVYGRNLHVPHAVEGDVARFHFGDLCQKELGPADFLTITSTYPTIIIEGIPQLKLNAKNEARRFITFLDAAYEAKTRLICLAAAEPDQIFFPDAASLLEAVQAGDSMVQETLGEISQDLAESFRPNISSYREEISAIEMRGEAARAAAAAAPAGKPAFSNLAIFTGQDEQFAYKRALSRIFEITSKEYVKTARHVPIPYEERVWEHSKPTKATVSKSPTPIRPDPTADQEDRSMLPPRGTKVDPLDPSIDPYQLPKPNIRPTHVWGMIETWGKKSGLWGMGVRAPGLTDHETRRNEQQERWKMIQADRAAGKMQGK